MGSGGFFVPSVAVEIVEVGEGTCHLRKSPRHRALCGYRAKDLADVEVDWEAIAPARRCSRCDAVLAESQRDEQDHWRMKIRLEVVHALLRAIDRIDEIQALVRSAEDHDAARAALMQPPFEFSDFEANHVLDLPIRRQTRKARADLEEERAALEAEVSGSGPPPADHPPET